MSEILPSDPAWLSYVKKYIYKLVEWGALEVSDDKLEEMEKELKEIFNLDGNLGLKQLYKEARDSRIK